MIDDIDDQAFHTLTHIFISLAFEEQLQAKTEVFCEKIKNKK